ncbi:MAG TPA: insulinase family protein [Caulobacteraceae bacterium]|nr:insulinase family protein [Caulobacteraceae bacterium]
MSLSRPFHKLAAVATLVVAAVFAAPMAGAAAGASSSERLAPDPGVVSGRLPNGLRYAIEQHASHQKEVIHFYVDAGSKDETDAERGVAHFLEHMAFNGSRRIPADTLTKTAENLGIGLGRDQNATTSYFSTDFTLDIPNVSAEKLDFAFLWLRDVADGLLLAPDQVERERHVVLSEYVQGLSRSKTIVEDSTRFEAPGLRSTTRLPIGQKAVIETVGAPALRAFYQRWYRPENVIVVAVGDETAASMKTRIEAAFSDWRNPTPKARRVRPGSIDFSRRSEAMAFSDPHMPSALAMCRFSRKRRHGPEDVGYHFRQMTDEFWVSIFGKRMAERARRPDAPFLGASAVTRTVDRIFDATCFGAVPKLDDWRSALVALTEESRRLEDHGVTPAEFAYASAQKAAALDALVASGPTHPPELIAASILGNLIEGTTFDTPEEDRRVDRLALARLSPAAVNAAMRSRWTKASPPLLILYGPTPVPAAELSGAWKQAQAAPAPGPPKDIVTTPWAYGDAATPGEIVSTESMKNPDFTRVTFRNGVVLNLKATKFAEDSASVRVAFGAGQRETPPGTEMATIIAGALLLQGAYLRNDFNDLVEVCKGRSCGASLGVGRDRFELVGGARRDDLDLELQVLAGFVREPGFRSEMDQAIPTAAKSAYRAYKTSPMLMAALKLGESKPKPQLGVIPPEAEAMAWKARDFAALLQDPLTQDALEVTIVGDIDETRTIAMVAATFGALPARRRVENVRPDAVYDRYASVAPPAQTTHHEGDSNQAAVLMSWPMFVYSPARAHEARVVALLAAIMQDKVTEQIRQKLGKSYSPSVSMSAPVRDDQSALTLSIQTTPDAVAAVRTAGLAIATSLAGGDITAADLEQARKPILEAIAKQKTYNDYWLNAMDGSFRHPEQLDYARTREADLAAITLAEIRQAGTRWLMATPYIAIALPQ